nr:sodium/hydrogen exchanger 11 isoform X1 [Equus asinus]XP_044613816.1 sodium/hydrogen exchanger 11 isoform X1 [Equus asinus]XP_044613817.1 sodium/hydrogen exchanger 11 isoform X1 [Equus asinus]XP_044613818.1 sodium/hydrogen exchanger 11 isoform X1 [Equus asinus]XP_044613819.1 sodium/hydrogen exchanger 11 isoform X1 [Equus asinus]XP_044613820.1 sodium/hydrogen exchanger 11 isoform X1 [Equus asinus]XP_044613821.1 sodium/hydrogen exchanger 11 isoform X1 [Equus asinus]
MNSSFWTQTEGSRPDLLCGMPADYAYGKGHFITLLCSAVVMGGFLRAYLKNSEVIVLAILSLSGFALGQVAYNIVEVHKVVYPLLRTPSFSLYCYFSPLIIFLAALDVDFYVLKNVLWQVLLTGLISFSTAFIIIGYVVLKFNKDEWDLQSCLLFSLTLGITDPIHSVNSLKMIGISKMYTDIIRGESMIICGFTSIVFGMFRRHSHHLPMFRELHMIVDLSMDIFGSIICGYWCARIIQFTLTDLFSNTLTNVIICVSMVYMTFYIVEFFGMSGMVALITVGLNLDSLSFKPRMEFIITKFFKMFSSVFQDLIYTFFGIVIGCGEIKYFRFHTVSFMFILFATVNVVRLLTTVLVSPILMRSSYEYNWRWGVVIAWSGIKGVFSLLLAPDIHNLAEKKTKSPQMFILYLLVTSLMTMGINSYMMTHSARTLGLCAISLPRQMAMQNAIKHIQEIIQNTITLFKTEKILTNVNWTLVEEKTKIEYIIPSDTVQFSHVSHDEKEEESPTDEVLMEEARLHIAIIQMRSFEKQCNNGILGVEAARILIGAAKSYCPIQGKFMSIYDVSTYVRARSWLMKFKNMLTFLDYRTDKAPLILHGNNKFMIFVYRIVFSEEFEYTGHIITFIYIYPMIMHLWPMARELNVAGLILVNYYFVSLYVLESALKIIILKRKYFRQYWNTLEFVIVLIGIFDIFFIHLVRWRPDNLVLIQIVIIIGYFRIIRFIPLIKIIIPLLINIADVQIKKRLSLMYSITKGYVKSQEDAKFLIKQISSRESINQKLYEILETNQRDAVKELGLIEHEGRDVVIALKTRQAIRNVIAKALKNLTFLWSRGIIDKHEGVEMNKVLLAKIKALNNFPMAIPPPTPEKYLHNILWLENKDVLIEFFKERAKLAYFDYGDVICKEGEMPQGIYLIISGMAILHSSPPTFGIDSALRPDRESKTMFTEYCTSGDVIGELSCLLKRESECTAICETILQACFISLEDLYEGFDVFWPSLEYKIWLKLALSIAYQYFESSLIDEDLTFRKCAELNLAYVQTLSSYNEMTIDNETMKFVIVVYGSVIDTKREVPYLAPCILPKTCGQVQGTSDLSKLLVIQASEPVKNNNNAKVMVFLFDACIWIGSVNTGVRMTKKEHNWKR